MSFTCSNSRLKVVYVYRTVCKMAVRRHRWRSPPRSLTLNKVRFFLKKLLAFCRHYFDCVVIICLLMNLQTHYDYYSTVLSSSATTKLDWWQWPVHHGWSIKGKVPTFDENENRLDVTKVEYDQPRYVKYPAKPQTSEEKLILFDHHPMEDFPQQMDPTTCGGKCRLSFNETRSTKIADAVVFSVDFPKVLPKRRFASQIYVWMLLENPSSTLYSHNHKNLFNCYKDFDSQFNLTMTYRRDSDIYMPYNTSYAIHSALLRQSDAQKPYDLLAGKKKLAMWASGNCAFTKGSSFRVFMMLRILNAGLSVDVYGSCLYRSLPGSWMDIISHLKPYKFYFSFENALHCRDYLTEKVWWNALSAGVVPVIWGPMRKDVEELLPAGSFIFVEDFKSVKELVDYLLYLDKNDVRYLRYFEWRFDKPKVDIAGRKKNGFSDLNLKVTGMCQLCHMLHADDQQQRQYGTRPQRIVKSIYKWWYLNETKTCLSPYPRHEKGKGRIYFWLLFNEVWFSTLTYFQFYTFVYSSLVIALIIRRYKSMLC